MTGVSVNVHMTEETEVSASMCDLSGPQGFASLQVGPAVIFLGYGPDSIRKQTAAIRRALDTIRAELCAGDVR